MMPDENNEELSLPVENPFEVAAKRVRNAVKPEGGRKEGEFTKQFTESANMPSAIALKLLTGPFYAAGDVPGFVNEFMNRQPGSNLSKEEVERGFNAAALTGAGAGIGRVTSEMRLPKIAGKATPVAEDQVLLDHIIERGKEFSSEEQARQQRALEQGYNTDAYHGTVKPEFDAFKTRENEIGSHFGTIEQVNRRLSDTSDYQGMLFDSFNNYKNPRVMPVKLKIQNSLRLEDKQGDWSFNTLKEQLMKNKVASKKEIDNIDNNYFTKKEKTQALNQLIQDKGYDSIVYKNRHEGVPSDVQNAINDTGKSIHELSEKELAKYPEIKDSYIPLNPANIRGKFAPFDPANQGQNMIMGLRNTQNKLNPNNPVEINAAPNMPQRPLGADYQNLRFKDVPNGVIQNDIEGRPLTAPIVAGRRIVGSGDQGLSAADIHRVATEGVQATINPTPRSKFAPGEAGSYNTRKNFNAPEHLTQRKIKFNMALDSLMRDRVVAHEVAHGIEHRSVGDDPWFAGGGYHISSKNMRDEMYRVYNDMNNENPAMIGKHPFHNTNYSIDPKATKGFWIFDELGNKTDNWFDTKEKALKFINETNKKDHIGEGIEAPELRGYAPQKVPRELWAESIRAYMDNPNYMKTVAPETAKAIRQMVNSNPQLSKVIQFNAEGSVPGAAIAALSKPFYSAVENAIKGAKQSTANAEQWLGTIKNSPGIKQEELNWTGLEDYIKSKDGKISKQELQDYMDNHKVELNEKISHTPNPRLQEIMDLDKKARELEANGDKKNANKIREQIKTIPSTGDFNARYKQYQLPGGENYREKLLTLPEKGKDNNLHWAAGGLAEDEGGNYHSSHWDEPNVLAHVRMNDRNIPDVGKTLHLEEIQSDWHQAGRESGYKNPLNEKEKQEYYELMNTMRTRSENDRYSELDQRHFDNKSVPNAPFKATWPDLVLKRMIREASEKGYDAISWSPGEVQNKRYSGRGIKEEEGMKEFYDKILVNKVNQLAKKFGGKVEEKDLNKQYSDEEILAQAKRDYRRTSIEDWGDMMQNEREAYVRSAKEKLNNQSQNVHVLKLTKELKDAAISKGFPLFSNAHPGMMFTPVDNHPDHKYTPVDHNPFE